MLVFIIFISLWRCRATRCGGRATQSTCLLLTRATQNVCDNFVSTTKLIFLLDHQDMLCRLSTLWICLTSWKALVYLYFPDNKYIINHQIKTHQLTRPARGCLLLPNHKYYYYVSSIRLNKCRPMHVLIMLLHEFMITKWLWINWWSFRLSYVLLYNNTISCHY